MTKGKQVLLVLSIIAVIIIFAYYAGNAPRERAPKSIKKAIGKISVNLCATDKENSEYWQKNNVNLFSLENGKMISKVGEIPACSSIDVNVTDRTKFNGIEYLELEHNGVTGWQDSQILANHASSSAPAN